MAERCMLVAQEPVWPVAFCCSGCCNAAADFYRAKHCLLLLLLLCLKTINVN